jgi:hypothetical protein
MSTLGLSVSWKSDLFERQICVNGSQERKSQNVGFWPLDIRKFEWPKAGRINIDKNCHSLNVDGVHQRI